MAKRMASIQFGKDRYKLSLWICSGKFVSFPVPPVDLSVQNTSPNAYPLHKEPKKRQLRKTLVILNEH